MRQISLNFISLQYPLSQAVIEEALALSVPVFMESMTLATLRQLWVSITTTR